MSSVTKRQADTARTTLNRRVARIRTLHAQLAQQQRAGNTAGRNKIAARLRTLVTKLQTELAGHGARGHQQQHAHLGHGLGSYLVDILRELSEMSEQR